MQSNTEKPSGLVLVDLTEPLTQHLVEARKRFGLPGRIVGVKLLIEDGTGIQELQFRDSDARTHHSSDSALSRLSNVRSKDTHLAARSNVISFENKDEEPL